MAFPARSLKVDEVTILYRDPDESGLAAVEFRPKGAPGEGFAVVVSSEREVSVVIQAFRMVSRAMQARARGDQTPNWARLLDVPTDADQPAIEAGFKNQMLRTASPTGAGRNGAYMNWQIEPDARERRKARLRWALDEGLAQLGREKEK